MSDLIDKAEAKAALQAWLDRHNYPVNPTLFHALDDLPARGVGVKPLVWKREADNAWVAVHYAIHQYWPHNNGPFAVSGYLGGLGAISLGKHPTLDAAKAAAQADYEARILAALEPAAHVNETLKSEHYAGDVLTAAQDDDPECTDCGGTGITYQTERVCACQPTDAAQAREAALREAAAVCVALSKGLTHYGPEPYNICASSILALLDEART